MHTEIHVPNLLEKKVVIFSTVSLEFAFRAHVTFNTFRILFYLTCYEKEDFETVLHKRPNKMC